MRAVVCSQLSDDFSGVDLKDIDAPQPGRGEVHLQVSAASLNFPDILMTRGTYQFRPDLPFVPGMEVCGTVIGLGDGVAGFEIGDRVTGGAKTGGFAQQIVLPAASLRHVPDRLSDAQAAGYGAAYLTAYVALVVRGRLEAGETLLVHGASGGVGLAAMDVGRLLGARVIATTGSPEKIGALKAAGAETVIDTADGFRETVKNLTDGRGADVIFDTIGGDVFDESVRCIAFGGRLLVVGFMSGRIADVTTNMPLIKGFSVVGVRAGEFTRRVPEAGRHALETIWSWAGAGMTRPHIHGEMGLGKTVDAMKMLVDRQVVGKLVIRP